MKKEIVLSELDFVKRLRKRERSEADMRAAERVKKIMHEQGYNQTSLALALGMKQSNVSRGLADFRLCGGKFEWDVCELLGVELETLLEERKPKKEVFQCVLPPVVGAVRLGEKTYTIDTVDDLQPLFVLREAQRKLQKILATCQANKEKLGRGVWTFRKGNHQKEGVVNALGNMCQGYPFFLYKGDYLFLNSEAAYIAGMFSHDTDEHFAVQHLLMDNNNGYMAKKEIRRAHEHLKRLDWEEYNVEWMKYVVWQKCLHRENGFAELLLKTEGQIIENTTPQTSPTSNFWGAKNAKWGEAYACITKIVEATAMGNSKEELTNHYENMLDYVGGKWVGDNMMGRILTECREALRKKTQPNINYDLLNEKRIYLFGQVLKF